MGKVTGKVTKVTKGKGIVTTKFGNYERLNVTVTDSTGTNTVIQKLTKPGNDGQGLMGKEFQVTYTEKELTNEETGESFTVRSADSKNWVSLDQQNNNHSNGGTTTQGNKDISMEVSGLLQAIIEHHGVTTNLETQLRMALDIKRRVAKELETGNMKQETKAATKVATVVKKAMTAPATEVQEDDESPFED